VADSIPETPEEVRELLEWARAQPTTEKELQVGMSMGAPHFVVLSYLAEECGIDRELIRAQLEAIGWTEAIEKLWLPGRKRDG
jgi:predicted alpha/beta-fold hydrolase